MPVTPEDRRVLTFYSFKGGVGRTMLLANTAFRLANRHGLDVIVVDWDLEAPGLHRFFGVSSEDAAKAPGLLDYFCAWRDALRRNAPEAPDVTDLLIPITDEQHAPRFGKLSLLTAGKLDDGYDTRLAALDWQEFYQGSAGASAVETLRAQLVDQADVILIDSRTGLTDAGGICTIQIPDGVALVTSPNQQSLEGIDWAARSIARSSAEARSGRARPRLWFVISRVPLIEETYLAEQWFARHEAWFAGGRSAGLWLDEDHPEGLQSHKIPHRGRWGLDEFVLNEATKVDPADLLGISYDRFAETMARWLRGEPPLGLEARPDVDNRPVDRTDLIALEAAVTAAERRGDIMGMADGLLDLASELVNNGRTNQAIRKAEQAGGIFLSRGARPQYLRASFILGHALAAERRHEEALKILTNALQSAREMGNDDIELVALFWLTKASRDRGDIDATTKWASEAYTLSERIPDGTINPLVIWATGDLLRRIGHHQHAIALLRRSARLAQSSMNEEQERDALQSLLSIADEHLEDADVLRARLAELASSTTAEPGKPHHKKARRKSSPR